MSIDLGRTGKDSFFLIVSDNGKIVTMIDMSEYDMLSVLSKISELLKVKHSTDGMKGD